MHECLVRRLNGLKRTQTDIYGLNWCAAQLILRLQLTSPTVPDSALSVHECAVRRPVDLALALDKAPQYRIAL